MTTDELCMKDIRVKQELKKALVAAGVPEESILVDKWIRLADGRWTQADMLVVGDDKEKVVVQFEVKFGVDPFGRACLTLRTLTRLYPCCVVTENARGEILVSAILKSRSPMWIPISKVQSIRDLLKELREEAVAMMELRSEQKIVATDLKKFRKRVGYWGVFLLLVLCVAELFGREFSWKIYASLFVLLAMFVVMFGYAVRIKFGDYEIAIEDKQGDRKTTKGMKKE